MRNFKKKFYDDLDRIKAILEFIPVMFFFIIMLFQHILCMIFKRKSWLEKSQENLEED